MTTQTSLNTATVPVSVPEGGTGIASATAYMPLLGGTTTTGAFQSVATATAGYVLTYVSDSAVPTFQAPGADGLAWVNVTGTTQAAAINSGYIITEASATTVTLPETAPLGALVAVVGTTTNTGLWTLAANTDQTIQFGTVATTSGGSWSSTNANDTIEIVCTVANTTWTVRSAVSAGLTKA